MSSFFWILISTVAVSLISFVAVAILFLKEKTLSRFILFFVSFSAGALLGAAFFDLLPEAAGQSGRVFIYTIAGFCLFFVLEQFIGWHHHHAKEHPELKPFSYLVLFSDGLHNFIDGVIIAGAYLADFSLGVTATLAVALHEIPQEIGDMGVLIYGGFKKLKALFLNFLSACLAILGGVLGFFFNQQMGGVSFLLALAAGGFIYIAAADLIPQIKEAGSPKKSLFHFSVFLAGLGLIWLLTSFLG